MSRDAWPEDLTDVLEASPVAVRLPTLPDGERRPACRSEAGCRRPGDVRGVALCGLDAYAAAKAAAAEDPTAFTERDREMLDFEALWWRHKGHKEAAVIERFGVSPTRYHQRLRQVARMSEAYAYAPAVCRRIIERKPFAQRMVERVQERRARRLGSGDERMGA